MSDEGCQWVVGLYDGRSIWDLRGPFPTEREAELWAAQWPPKSIGQPYAMWRTQRVFTPELKEGQRP